jgi:hypothetical protein
MRVGAAALQHRSARRWPPQEEFRLVLDRRLVEQHDPTKAAAHGLGKRWRDLLEAKRAAFLAGIDRIGITHKVTRLQRLERHHNKMEAAGNIATSPWLRK